MSNTNSEPVTSLANIVFGEKPNNSDIIQNLPRQMKLSLQEDL